jgi:hypothetical protein
MEFGRHTHEEFWEFDLGGKRVEDVLHPLMSETREASVYVEAA